MNGKDEILRHRTAIARNALSRPVQQAIEDAVLRPGKSVFDYGCGRGIDVLLLKEAGYEANGWDPEFNPSVEKSAADLVNLGYVVNVVEDIDERRSVLREAFSLAKDCLIVSAQLSYQGRVSTGEAYADGIVTRRNTFQKYFSQDELREFIESTLEVEANPAAPGVFYAFRNEAEKQALLLRKIARRRIAVPRRILSIEERLAPYRELLQSFAATVESLGRLPREQEFGRMPDLRLNVGSPKRCIDLCERLFEGFRFEEFRGRAQEDLLTYVALSRFRRRPKFGVLPEALKWDFRDLFGSYSKACEEGDTLLFKVGDPDQIDAACIASKIGKLLPTALYVHTSAMAELTPILRVYAGCGRALIGDVPDANVVKIHRFTGKLSYLAYPTFDDDPHPALVRSLTVNLRTREVRERDYSQSANPPILHRKETFLLPVHPRFEEFNNLTTTEEAAELLDTSEPIGFRQQWEEHLKRKGYFLEGHHLRKGDVGATPAGGPISS
jgi:DNA phosphorothioation-associated putative methyltransferase